MKKLHRLVITSYAGPFVVTFFISLFVLLMQFLWKYIDDLVGKGLEWHIIGELMFYASASLVPMALPLAVLLSSIMTMGSMGEHYELVALRSSGISLFRVLYPLIVLNTLISLGAFYFSNTLLPVSNLKMGTLLYDIRHKKPALDIRPGVFYKNIDGYAIRVVDKGEEDELYGVMIYDHTDNKGNIKVILADSGTMSVRDNRWLEMELFNGRSYEQQDNSAGSASYPHVRNEFSRNLIRFDLSGFEMSRSNEDMFKENLRMQSLGQLYTNIDTLRYRLQERILAQPEALRRNFAFLKADSGLAKAGTLSPDTAFDVMALIPPHDRARLADGALNMARSGRSLVLSARDDIDSRIKRLRYYWIEVHRKFTLSTACLILFFIGAPLGAIIRKGGLGLPTVFAIAFFLVYYLTSFTGEKFVKEEIWPVWKGMWVSSFVLLPVGIFLTWRAVSDSAIFEWEFYADPVRKLIDRIRHRDASPSSRH